MLVIPAIDVSAGRLAKLDSGRRVALDAFGGDPLEAARRFAGAGASWAHVVDMDLAFTGRVSDLGFMSKIATAGLMIQASGGITAGAEIEAFLSAGASRVVLGSRALGSLGEVERLIGIYGERLAVGLETDGSVFRPRGMRGDSPEAVIDLPRVLGRLLSAGVARFVCTAVLKVASLSGPGEEALADVLAQAGSVPVIAAGGVGDLSDVRRLEAMGVEGVVVGRALYEGGLDLAEAIRYTHP